MKAGELIVRAGVLLLLAGASLPDIRTRSFPVLPVTAGAFVLLLIRFLPPAGLPGWAELLAGAIPGLFFYLLCRITHEAVGRGDALIVFFLGMLGGFRDSFAVCFLALVMAGLCGLGLMAAGRAGKDTGMPFIPFLLAAYMALLAAGAF